MGRRLALTLAIALAGLAACGDTRGDNEAVAAGNAAVPAANSAIGAANDAAPAAGNDVAGAGALNRAYMVGRWTETDNCEQTVEFRPDGSMLLPWGDEARWELEGNVLSMVGNPQVIRLEVTGPGTMDATKESGTVQQWRRC
jgi:hypothetical protein